jgi:transcriptional regulator with XRE-family HTH domain
MTSSKPSFPSALRAIRKARGLSQEAFSDISSRTYLSSIERGLKVPTISKVEQLCEVLEVHPLTLYALSYVGKDKSPDKVLAQVRRELDEVYAQLEKKGRRATTSP